MKEQLIDFETAILANNKEFRFNADWEYIKLVSNTSKVNEYLPTQSLLQKWLRERHNLNVEITHYSYNKRDKHFAFRCIVKTITKTKYIDNNSCESNIDGDFYIFRSYEEALEQGLKEALNLIK